MNNQSTRNLQGEDLPKQPRLKSRRSSSRIQLDKLNQIQHDDCFLSKILCLHHIRTALTYLCSLDKKNIIKYNTEYERFITTTKLRDTIVSHIGKEEEFNVLSEALKLQAMPIFLIVLLSLMTGACSVVVIYYQQTLAKYIITLARDEQYKWLGIIVGCIVLRFLLFNYLTALANNVAVNIKVGLENLFMRTVFFLDHSSQELSMHRMKFIAIEHLIEAITFFPYALVAFSTIIGVVVLLFNLNNYYGFVYFGIVLFCFIIHLVLLLLVYNKLRQNQRIKEQTAQESKWIFRSLIQLIFDKISTVIVERLSKSKQQSLNCDRFYNASYSISQFLADASTVVSIIVYYGLNREGIKDMTLLNTYLSAVYLGMLYFPFKIFIFGSYAIIRGYEQYNAMVDSFKSHLRQRTMRDMHIAGMHHEPQIHAYADNLGNCFNYNYPQEESSPRLAQHKIKRSMSNIFMDLEVRDGETVMAYFNTNNRKQVQRYIKELMDSLPFDKTVAIINQNHLILPQPLQQNILFYSEYNETRYQKVLKLVELDYFKDEIEAIGNSRLNYRIAKFYPWHQCRVELARALYNSVDYLFINKHILIEDEELLKNVIEFRKQEGKTTLIANSWNLHSFHLADRLVIIQGEKREIGTYRELKQKNDSLLNEIQNQLQRQGVVMKSQEVQNHHQNFLAVIAKQKKPLQLSRFAYLEYFNFAHWGGCLVVLLAMLSPIGFKVYMNWLIGQSTKKIIYPDIIIFGVLYLFFILIRGLVLSFYFRQASVGLFNKILQSNRQLCGDQLLSVLKEKDDSIQNAFQKVDSNMVICFQLAITVMFELWGALVIIGIGQAIVLAMALPLMLIIAGVNALYNRMERSLLVLRSKYQDQLKTFINHCTTRASPLFRYGKYREIQTRFNQLHRMNVMFTCNQLWALSGMRMIGQIFIIIGVTIFLVIMIQTQSNKITNLAMVSYGVSLFVNMNFSYRFNIKAFAIIEAQMLALTKCLNFYKTVDEQAENSKKKQRVGYIENEEQIEIKQIERIQMGEVCIQFGTSKCSKINLKMSKGDRIAVSAQSRSLATLPFYLLQRNVFSSDHIYGDITINGRKTNKFYIHNLFYLHSKAVLPYQGTVYQTCQKWNTQITQQQCTRLLKQFFRQCNLSQLFSVQDPINSLHLGFQQILSVFRIAKLQTCNILVMVSAFDYMDVLTRIKIEKYLIKQPISIIVSITNNPEIINLYQRHLIFQNGQFHEDSTGNTKQEHNKPKQQ